MAFLRNLSLISLVLVGLVLLLGAGLLVEAHIEIRRLLRPLPATERVLAFGRAEALEGTTPIAIRYVQSGKNLGSNGSYLTTGGFLLEWSDGRLFAIDLGMSEPAMRDFSVLLEVSLGSGPAELFGSLGHQLAEDATRIEGVAFTHLHTDHAEGAIELCEVRSGRALVAYQTPDQFERQNYTTTPGRDHLEDAGCIEARPLDADTPLMEIPGFPGLAAFAVGGHTPGSTAFVARVQDRLFVFAGDISNVHANLMEDVSKGFVYSTFITPEATARLGELRPWLAAFHAPPDVEVVVSHDLAAIEASGIWVRSPRAVPESASTH